MIVRIVGEPAPQGSKTGRVVHGRVVMWESSKKVKPWRKQVAEQTATQIKELTGHKTYTLNGPIEISIVFLLAKPKSVKRKHPTVKPDLDKLVRSTLDGLTTAGVWKDDSQVIALSATKTYTTTDPTGAIITIDEVL